MARLPNSSAGLLHPAAPPSHSLHTAATKAKAAAAHRRGNSPDLHASATLPAATRRSQTAAVAWWTRWGRPATLLSWRCCPQPPPTASASRRAQKQCGIGAGALPSWRAAAAAAAPAAAPAAATATAAARSRNPYRQRLPHLKSSLPRLPFTQPPCYRSARGFERTCWRATAGGRRSPPQRSRRAS